MVNALAMRKYACKEWLMHISIGLYVIGLDHDRYTSRIVKAITKTAVLNAFAK